MKTTTKILALFIFYTFVLNTSNAQEARQCGTTEMNQKRFETDPQLYQDYLKENARLEALDKEAYTNGYKDNSRAAGTVYTFPIVFHIIHNNGAENISDAQVKDGLRILNEDFRKLNPSFSTTVAAFKPIAADMEIEFCLATKDPNGNPTTGIDRVVSSKTGSADDNAKLNPWNTNKYLNIWLVKKLASGSSGFTYYPTTNVGWDKDGVLIEYDYVGSIGSGQPRWANNLSHEVGHYFNILHTFEGGNTSTCGTADGVSDTPNSKQHNWSNSCPPANDASCGSNANQNNFMDYTFCYTMFTEGQKTRARSAVTTSPSRKNLWSTANLAATGCASTVGLSNELFNSADFSIYPNPLEENTLIKFNLVDKQKVEINIYNVVGQQVETAFQGELNPGEHEFSIGNKINLQSGVYFIKLTIGDQNRTKKMIVN